MYIFKDRTIYENVKSVLGWRSLNRAAARRGHSSLGRGTRDTERSCDLIVKRYVMPIAPLRAPRASDSRPCVLSRRRIAPRVVSSRRVARRQWRIRQPRSQGCPRLGLSQIHGKIHTSYIFTGEIEKWLERGLRTKWSQTNSANTPFLFCQEEDILSPIFDRILRRNLLIFFRAFPLSLTTWKTVNANSFSGLFSFSDGKGTRYADSSRRLRLSLSQ